MLYEDTPELRRKPAPSVSYNDSNSTGKFCVCVSILQLVEFH